MPLKSPRLGPSRARCYALIFFPIASLLRKTTEETEGNDASRLNDVMTSQMPGPRGSQLNHHERGKFVAPSH